MVRERQQYRPGELWSVVWYHLKWHPHVGLRQSVKWGSLPLLASILRYATAVRASVNTGCPYWSLFTTPVLVCPVFSPPCGVLKSLIGDSHLGKRPSLTTVPSLLCDPETCGRGERQCVSRWMEESDPLLDYLLQQSRDKSILTASSTEVFYKLPHPLWISACFYKGEKHAHI